MIYDFVCDCRQGKYFENTAQQINVSVKEYYIPNCPHCKKPMKRLYGCNIIAGVLDRNNLPK